MYKSRERRSAPRRARSFPPFPPSLFLQTTAALSVTKHLSLSPLSLSLSCRPFYVFIQTKNEHTNCSRRAFTHTYKHTTSHLWRQIKITAVWTLKHVNYHLRVDETTYRNERDDHKEKKGRLFYINCAISVSSNYSRF